MPLPEDAAMQSCECLSWERVDAKFLTVHHRNCEHYDPEGDAAKIIRALLKGIECWCRDEDGVHPDCWEAYKRAKMSIGEPLEESSA